MGRVVIMHIDEALWIRGGAAKDDGSPALGTQLIGDLEKGPFIDVNSLAAGMHIAPHSHSEDETIYILEGSLKMGSKVYGAGTVLWVEKDTQYGFDVAEGGVRFLAVRPGLAKVTKDGKTVDSYADPATTAEMFQQR